MSEHVTPSIGNSTAWLSFTENICRIFVEAIYGQSRSIFLWVPVIFSCGIGVYFALSKEPPIWVAVVLFCIAAACFLLAFFKRTSAFPTHGTILFRLVIMALGIMCSGMLTAQVRTLVVAGPVLDRPMNTKALIAYVENKELTRRGYLRLTLTVDTIEELSPEDTPDKLVLVSYRLKHTDVEEGNYIKAAARLEPSYRPTHPGAYDPARQDYYKSIGGRGRILGDVQILDKSHDSFSTNIQKLRSLISDHILSQVSARSGGDDAWQMGTFATALITGKRSHMDKDLVSVLREAGLAHILAISGLHMVLFTGALFWIARVLMALSPRLALNHPIKKYAALLGIIGGVIYLCLSGAPISAQRAFIMTCIMFVAILFDRRAISLHNLALAALFILIMSPESLMSVSFQMSFASVGCLIAFYETFVYRRPFTLEKLGPFRGSISFLLAISLTTLIASLATAPFVIHYFGYMPLYGLLANLIVMPIFTLLTMPLALLGLFLLPLGVSGFVFEMMGSSLALISQVALFVSGLTGAEIILPEISFLSLVFFILAGLWAIVWTGYLKWGAFAFVPLAFITMSNGDKPDILISETGRMMAVQHSDGKLSLSDKGSAYVAGRWLQYYGDSRGVKSARADMGVRCDAEGCASSFYKEKGKAYKIVLVRDRTILMEECAQADILIVAVPVRMMPRMCTKPQLIISRLDLWRLGAHALTLDEDQNWHVKTASSQQGERPWNRDWVYNHKHARKED